MLSNPTLKQVSEIVKSLCKKVLAFSILTCSQIAMWCIAVNRFKKPDEMKF